MTAWLQSSMLTAVALETSCSAGMLEVSTGRGPVGLQKGGRFTPLSENGD